MCNQNTHLFCVLLTEWFVRGHPCDGVKQCSGQQCSEILVVILNTTLNSRRRILDVLMYFLVLKTFFALLQRGDNLSYSLYSIDSIHCRANIDNSVHVNLL